MGIQSLRIVLTGSSGLVGSALLPYLKTRGHRVSRLLRSVTVPEGNISWDPAQGRLDAEALEGLDAVIHLAGESIAARRWSQAQKQRILTSRVESTSLLCETLCRLKKPPKVLISASAIGYYGDRGNEELTESSAPGIGFLAQVCQEWEQATQAAEKQGIRVVRLRIGIVLSPKGGALSKMLLPFSLGLGGPVGSGTQQMSWIAIDDLLVMTDFLLKHEALSGPVNATAPQAVSNAEFAHILGRVLRRPAILPLPVFAVRLIFGEMGKALLLSSSRVKPERLMQEGFHFQHPELEGALRHLLYRPDF